MEKQPKIDLNKGISYEEILKENNAAIKDVDEQIKFWTSNKNGFQDKIDAILEGKITNQEDQNVTTNGDKDVLILDLKELISICEKNITDCEKFIKFMIKNGSVMLDAANFIEQRHEIAEIAREDGENIDPGKLPN